MSMVLYNPTNEMFRVTFGGKSFLVKGELSLDPREAPTKVKVTDACGRHVINELGPRGLMALDYGDDEYEVGKQGQAVNKKFKTKQIEYYNQQNEARKQMGLPYNAPTEILIQYSRELGIKLSEPYRVEDLAITQSQQLLEAMKQKDKEIEELKQGFAELIAAIKGGSAEKLAETVADQATKEVTQEVTTEVKIVDDKAMEGVQEVIIDNKRPEDEDEPLADSPPKKGGGKKKRKARK